MKRRLASRARKEIAEIEEVRLDREFRERIEGTKRYNTFDLEDVDKLDLQSLSGPMLEDVKKVVLYADEKRRVMEDFRAFRRNRNEWLILAVSICIGVILPFVVEGIQVWALNACALAPQSVLLAIKTVRRY